MNALPTALKNLGLSVWGDALKWEATDGTTANFNAYRYALGRNWDRAAFDPSYEAHPDRKVALFVLHNPSNASHLIDDPTLKRCVGFAKREGCGGLVIVNVMAYRATDKVILNDVTAPIVGPMNRSVVLQCLAFTTLTIVGWGKLRPARADVYASRDELLGLLKDPQCFGKNKDGSPGHPLYVWGEKRLEPFSASSP